ncbi:hypothetical protein ES703_13636 [subsurface metagenome]
MLEGVDGPRIHRIKVFAQTSSSVVDLGILEAPQAYSQHDTLQFYMTTYVQNHRQRGENLLLLAVVIQRDFKMRTKLFSEGVSLCLYYARSYRSGRRPWLFAKTSVVIRSSATRSIGLFFQPAEVNQRRYIQLLQHIVQISTAVYGFCCISELRVSSDKIRSLVVVN